MATGASLRQTAFYALALALICGSQAAVAQSKIGAQREGAETSQQHLSNQSDTCL